MRAMNLGDALSRCGQKMRDPCFLGDSKVSLQLNKFECWVREDGEGWRTGLTSGERCVHWGETRIVFRTPCAVRVGGLNRGNRDVKPRLEPENQVPTWLRFEMN